MLLGFVLPHSSQGHSFLFILCQVFSPFVQIFFLVSETLIWSPKSELYSKVYSEKCHCPMLCTSPLTPYPLYSVSTLELQLFTLISFWCILPGFCFLVLYKEQIHVYMTISHVLHKRQPIILTCTFSFHLTIQPANHSISVHRDLSHFLKNHTAQEYFKGKFLDTFDPDSWVKR